MKKKLFEMIECMTETQSIIAKNDKEKIRLMQKQFEEIKKDKKILNPPELDEIREKVAKALKDP